VQDSNRDGAAPGTVVDTSRLYPARALRGQWSLPGGLQELGERTDQAAVREVMEETGIAIAVDALIDVIDVIQHDDEGRVRVHYTLLDYLARPVGGRLRAGSDADDAAWVPLGRIPELQLWDETRRVIEAAAALRRRLRP
jgi:8-oxo-dGTP diphosphatase